MHALLDASVIDGFLKIRLGDVFGESWKIVDREEEQSLRRVPRIALSMADFARLSGAVVHMWSGEFRAYLLEQEYFDYFCLL
jgi:hypothetical protein